MALYWAKALATQTKDLELKNQFSPISLALSDNEEKIINELNAIQGNSTNIGGYYLPNDEVANKAMQPSITLNTILKSI